MTAAQWEVIVNYRRQQGATEKRRDGWIDGLCLKRNEMIVLDFLFNVCFAPFQNVKNNGRLAALIWLTPSLTFVFMGSLIWLTNVLFDVRLFSHASALAASITSVTIFVGFYLLLNRIYLTGNRDAGEIKFTILYILILPILVIGSIVFFAFAINKFG
jgi:hypothetical protein